MSLYNPAHPGLILDTCFVDDQEVAKAAANINLPLELFTRILKGKAPITAEIAFLLAGRLGLHTAGTWIKMQANFDAWQAEHNERWQERVLQKYGFSCKASGSAKCRQRSERAERT